VSFIEAPSRNSDRPEAIDCGRYDPPSKLPAVIEDAYGRRSVEIEAGCGLMWRHWRQVHQLRCALVAAT
jgi:hypothetical protein